MLLIRGSRHLAFNNIQRASFTLYRTVLNYYSGHCGEDDEDAFDMRKALSRDPGGKSVVPLEHPVGVEDLE